MAPLLLGKAIAVGDQRLGIGVVVFQKFGGFIGIALIPPSVVIT